MSSTEETVVRVVEDTRPFKLINKSDGVEYDRASRLFGSNKNVYNHVVNELNTSDVKKRYVFSERNASHEVSHIVEPGRSITINYVVKENAVVAYQVIQKKDNDEITTYVVF